MFSFALSASSAFNFPNGEAKTTMTHPLSDKKVLLTTSHTDVGSGGSMQMFLLARGLREAGARVDVLFKENRSGKAPKLDLYEALDVPVHFFRPDRWWSPVQIARLRRRLSTERYDIVHTHKGGDLSLVLLASRGIEIPVLVTTRGVNFPLGANRFKYNAKKLDRIIVVSNQSRQVMVDCGVNPEKIELIYGGVDTGRFAPGGDGARIREEFSIPLGAPLFVVVANLVRQKGHADYLKAAAILETSHPGCFHLFAGSGNPANLQQTARELGIENQIIFAGFRQDMLHVYGAATASVFPGFAGEGVSGVLRESLACGVAVITTDVGGNAELIQHEKYGLVVPKRDPARLAEAMARLLDEPEFLKKLADQGREFVVANHSMVARNKRIVDLYLSILKTKKA